MMADGSLLIRCTRAKTTKSGMASTIVGKTNRLSRPCSKALRPGNCIWLKANAPRVPTTKLMRLTLKAITKLFLNHTEKFGCAKQCRSSRPWGWRSATTCWRRTHPAFSTRS